MKCLTQSGGTGAGGCGGGGRGGKAIVGSPYGPALWAPEQNELATISQNLATTDPRTAPPTWGTGKEHREQADGEGECWRGSRGDAFRGGGEVEWG